MSKFTTSRTPDEVPVSPTGLTHEAIPPTGRVGRMLGILSLLNRVGSIDEAKMRMDATPPIYSVFDKINAHISGKPQPPLTSHEIEWQILQLERYEELMQTPLTEAEVALLQLQLDNADIRAAQEAARQEFQDHPEELAAFMELLPGNSPEWQETIENR